MDIAEAVAFVSSHHHAILATRRADRRPQLSPIAVAVDDSGRLLISTREPAVKTRNIRRDPNVSLCVLSDGFFGSWVQLDGTAEIVELPDALELLEAAYRQIAGDHPDWDDFRRAMVAERRVALRITVSAAGPNISG